VDRYADWTGRLTKRLLPERWCTSVKEARRSRHFEEKATFFMGRKLYLLMNLQLLQIINHLEQYSTKPLIQPPARNERWLLKLQLNDFTVIYQPVKHNPADYMSRHPIPSTKI
jgi:hypothetical protein